MFDENVIPNSISTRRMTFGVDHDFDEALNRVLGRLSAPSKASCLRYSIALLDSILTQRDMMEADYPLAEKGSHQLYWVKGRTAKRAPLPTFHREGSPKGKGCRRMTLDVDDDLAETLDRLKRRLRVPKKSPCIRYSLILLDSILSQRDELDATEDSLKGSHQLYWLKGRVAKRAKIPHFQRK